MNDSVISVLPWVVLAILFVILLALLIMSALISRVERSERRINRLIELCSVQENINKSNEDLWRKLLYKENE